MAIEIGEVEALYRYPVKSMRGELLDAAELGWHGLAGDRRLAFFVEALEDDFELRGMWFGGSKEAFAWLQRSEPAVHSAFAGPSPELGHLRFTTLAAPRARDLRRSPAHRRGAPRRRGRALGSA